MTLTAEQHDVRSRGLGGSDAAAALGFSKWKTPVQLYLEKVGDAANDDVTDGPRYWGNVLEDIVATEYVKRTGNKVRRRRQAFVHPEHDFMLAHIDRSVDGQRKVLECKTSTDFRASDWGPDGSDEVPDEYLIQVQHQLACTGYEHADLAVLIGNRDYRIYHIRADPGLIAGMIDKEHHFWHDHVLAGTAPPPMTAQDIADLYPQDTGAQLLADEDLITAHESLVQVRAQLKELQDSKDELEQYIKAALGEAGELVAPDGRKLVTWRTSKPSKRLDTKALKEDHPDIHDQYTVEQPGSRRFLVK